jgi:hypothetical protein
MAEGLSDRRRKSNYPARIRCLQAVSLAIPALHNCSANRLGAIAAPRAAPRVLNYSDCRLVAQLVRALP